jgi:general secretion pathway protein D
MRRLTRLSGLLVALALFTGCAAGRAFGRGEDRARVGDWDAAVTYFREAMQADPDKAEYRIALERAMLNASRVHFDSARQLEAKDQLDAALAEYRRTVEYDPGNSQAVDKIVQLEKTIRDRIEASRPKPAIVQLREQARQAGAAPLLNPASRAPFDFSFKQSSLRDVLTFISNATGINVIYDASFQDRPVTIQLLGSVEQALNTLLSSQGLFYTVLDERTIVVAQDSAPNRLKYERQVAITVPISYADATEIAQMLTAITRTTTGVTIPPVIIPNKTANTITVRATQPVIDVIQALVLSNDKPRAEITLDVEILEVSRTRTKELGLNLTQYQIGGIFSPEQAPPGSPGVAASDSTTDSRPFNLNTITQGVSTADFYLTVPQAIVKFLESDTNTRVLTQTQLRGSEGAQLILKIGADEPYLTTSFAPIAGGGANVNPLSSYTFRTVGINVQATPRLVTDEGDVLMELVMSNDTLGPPRLVGGAAAPSFPTRSVTTKLRLRDGESHLLAGLLQDDERRSMRGFPGVISIPVVKYLFGNSDDIISQTDIVMLLTPRIIRTHQYTAQDLAPIYLGTNQNFGLTGPPPLIAAPPSDAAPAPGAPPGAPAQGIPPPGLPVPTVPQGGAPGLVTPVPEAPPPAPAGQPQAGTPPLAEPPLQKDPAAPQTTALAPTAQVTVIPPQGDVRVGAGPYLAPVYISGVSRASTVSVTVTFNPAIMRVRTVQEGSFLRQGAINVVFTPNIDAAAGRIDLTFVRTGDAVGASGSGLLAAIQFDAIASGTSQLTLSGVASNPTGVAIPLQFVPASVVVR